MYQELRSFTYPYDRLHRFASAPFMEMSESILDEVEDLESPMKEEVFVALILAADDERKTVRRQLAA